MELNIQTIERGKLPAKRIHPTILSFRYKGEIGFPQKIRAEGFYHYKTCIIRNSGTKRQKYTKLLYDREAKAGKCNFFFRIGY